MVILRSVSGFHECLSGKSGDETKRAPPDQRRRSDTAPERENAAARADVRDEILA
jgi:hypothetical protein